MLFPPFALNPVFFFIDPHFHHWNTVEVLRDEFIYAQSVDDVQPKVHDAGEATTLGFVAGRVRTAPEDTFDDAVCLANLTRPISHLPFHSHTL